MTYIISLFLFIIPSLLSHDLQISSLLSHDLQISSLPSQDLQYFVFASVSTVQSFARSSKLWTQLQITHPKLSSLANTVDLYKTLMTPDAIEIGFLHRSIGHKTKLEFEFSLCLHTHYSIVTPLSHLSRLELLLFGYYPSSSPWMTRNSESSAPSSSPSSSSESETSGPGLLDDILTLASTPRQALGFARTFFDEPEAPEDPSDTNAANMTTLTPDQFTEFLKSIGKKSAAATLDVPRLGGTNTTGAWTGFGAGELQQEPASSSCMRAFNTDVLKNHQAISPIEAKCKEGLSKSPELQFCMASEPNAKLIIYSIHSFEDLMIQAGMDGIFTLVKDDLTTVNMLKQPGMITTDLVKTWCEDVLVKGVCYKDSNGAIGRLPLCPYDRTNMIWSGEALLNSCSVVLKEDLKLSLAAGDRTGPRLIMSLLSKLYRPSQSKIRALKELLEALDITKYPGENVTLFVQDATKLIREIRMNFMSGSNVPDLTTSALTGLTKCSDPLLLQLVRNKRMESDVNGFDEAPGNSTADPITVLQELERTYCVLINQNDYGPARSAGKRQVPSLEAMVGELMDAKMAQNRSANSTTGNQGRLGGPGQKGQCHDCGSTAHYKGHPDCLGPSGSSTGTSGSTAGTSGTGDVRASKHGLDDATHAKVLEACKLKLATLPPRDHIADSEQYCITIDGKDLAKYCRHCGRFTKGQGAHYTTDHQGTRNRWEYKGPAPGQSTGSGNPPPILPAPIAAGNLASASPTNSPNTSINLAEVPQISTEDFTQGRSESNYEFGVGSYLAAALENEDEDGFYECLVKGYGG